MRLFEHLVIIHYHFAVGGVTSVIAKALSEILRDPSPSTQYKTITCLSASKPDALTTVLEHAHASHYTRLRVLTHSCFGYLNPTTSLARRHTISNTIHNVLRGLAKPHTLFWIHNYHLGKNPLLTRCLIDFFSPEAFPNKCHCIFHIHDFPEDGRYDNYQVLSQEIPPNTLYPRHPHISYACINSHDATCLHHHGIPATVIPNIVHYTPTHPAHYNQRHKQTLLEITKESSNYNLQSTSDPYTLLLYPVRAIRRKNVLEAMLITNMLNETSSIPVLMALTLFGASAQEEAYSKLCKTLFTKKKVVSGFFGLGHWLSEYATKKSLTATGRTFDFATLCDCADLFISSSCKEGFGIGFIHAPQHHSPLLARSLPVRADIEMLFSGSRYPRYWYDSLHIPLEFFDSKERTRLYHQYMKKLKHIKHLISSQSYTDLTSQIDICLLETDMIDFSFLSHALQTKVLIHSTDTDFIKTIGSINSTLLDTTHSLIRTKHTASTQSFSDSSLLQHAHTAIAQSLDTHYSYESWKKAVSLSVEKESTGTLIKKTHRRSSASSKTTPDDDYLTALHALPTAKSSLVENFLSLESLRVLYDRVDEDELAIYLK